MEAQVEVWQRGGGVRPCAASAGALQGGVDGAERDGRAVVARGDGADPTAMTLLRMPRVRCSLPPVAVTCA